MSRGDFYGDGGVLLWRLRQSSRGLLSRRRAPAVDQAEILPYMLYMPLRHKLFAVVVAGDIYLAWGIGARDMRVMLLLEAMVAALARPAGGGVVVLSGDDDAAAEDGDDDVLSIFALTFMVRVILHVEY